MISKCADAYLSKVFGDIAFSCHLFSLQSNIKGKISKDILST